MKKYEKPSAEAISLESAELISAFASFDAFNAYEGSFVTSYTDMSGRGFVTE